MLDAFKKTVLTGTILSILSPWGLAQGQDLPDDNQTIPTLGDMATEHNLDLVQPLLEYDGEDYHVCVSSADRQADREMRICDSLPSDIARERCRNEVQGDYERMYNNCSMVGERESQSSNSGCTQGGNQTHNEVNVRNSGNNNGNKTSSKSRRR